MPFGYNHCHYTQRNRVKEIRSFLLSTFLLCFTLFSFTGCEDKKTKETLIPAENSTEVVIEKKKEKQKQIQVAKVTSETNATNATNEANKTNEIEITPEPGTKKEPIIEETLPVGTFILNDTQENTHKLTISDQKINFHDINQSIVVVNFFSTWHAPSCGEIPYLSDLQKKHEKHIFIVGILINDVMYDRTLQEFIRKYHANYFISNSKQNDAFAAKIVKELQLPENFTIPLTVVYKDGDYYTHYEGAVPVEMIDHDIQQVIK